MNILLIISIILFIFNIIFIILIIEKHKTKECKRKENLIKVSKMLEKRNKIPKFDIVITWVNMTGNIDDHDEIIYLLRSIFKNGYNYVNNIYIVYADKHNDLYGKPEKLQETDNIKFLSHKQLGLDTLVTRGCQIPFLFTKIPNLTPLFFHIEDDQFIMNENIFINLLKRYMNNLVTVDLRNINYEKELELYLNKKTTNWVLSMQNAANLFKMNKYSYHIHTLCLYDKNILIEIEDKYNQYWENSKIWTSIPQNKHTEFFNLWALYSSYLLTQKQFKPFKIHENIDYIEFHTNGFASLSKKELNLKLNDIIQQCNNTKAHVINLQGDGISGEYTHNDYIYITIFNWLNTAFPTKTPAEMYIHPTKFDKLTNNNI